MEKLRVIQWNTGKVGKLSLRAILDDPRLELAGVFAHSPDKIGKDAGQLCGRPETGVLATDDIGWAIDDDQYHIAIKGEPNIDTRIRFTPPESWANHDWDTMTALPAVSAIFDIKAARPGVLGLRDVGLPYAPAGVWRGRA